MTLHERVEEVFRQVLGDESLELQDQTRSADIPAWDSLAHINLMFALEQAFGVHFAGNQLAEFRDVGQLKRWLSRRKAA